MNVYLLEKMVLPGMWEIVTAHASKASADSAMETTKMVFERLSRELGGKTGPALKNSIFRVREFPVQV